MAVSMAVSMAGMKVVHLVDWWVLRKAVLLADRKVLQTVAWMVAY